MSATPGCVRPLPAGSYWKWACYPQPPLYVMGQDGEATGVGGQWNEQQLKRRSLVSRGMSKGTRKLDPHIALLYMEPSKIQRCQSR